MRKSLKGKTFNAEIVKRIQKAKRDKYNLVPLPRRTVKCSAETPIDFSGFDKAIAEMKASPNIQDIQEITTRLLDLLVQLQKCKDILKELL